MEEDRRFMRLIAALIFLAVCAYIGAGLWKGMGTDAKIVTVQSLSISESVALEGIALRREQQVSPAPGQAPADGSRLRAGTVLGDYAAPCSVLYRSQSDGLESLWLEAEKLSVSAVSALLAAEPSSKGGDRVILDYCWYFAALADSSAQLSTGACSILFEGMEQPTEARIISLSPAEDGKQALLLRLTVSGKEYEDLRKSRAELILSRHSGLSLPKEALHSDEQGNFFVYTLTAGLVERKAVDIIYTDGKTCLAALSSDADALRPGNSLIVSGTDIYEGRVIG